MKDQLNKPKRFGEILDTTFTVSRQNFVEFVKIFFIIVGPLYIIQALIELLYGGSLFIDKNEGDNWFEQIINSFAVDDELAIEVEGEFLTVFILLLSVILLVVAQVAVLYAINQIRLGEEFTINGVIRRAFSRFWPLLRATILLFIALIIATVVLVFIAVLFGMFLPPVLAILLGIVFFFGIIAFFVFFGVKFSLYAGAIAFGEKAFSSMRESWRLTRGHFWILVGVYFVFSVIIGTVNQVFGITFGLILGNSVLFGLLVNAITLITTMITSVAYGVVYLDLYVRHDSTDLKEMISEYDEQID